MCCVSEFKAPIFQHSQTWAGSRFDLAVCIHSALSFSTKAAQLILFNIWKEQKTFCVLKVFCRVLEEMGSDCSRGGCGLNFRSKKTDAFFSWRQNNRNDCREAKVFLNSGMGFWSVRFCGLVYSLCAYLSRKINCSAASWRQNIHIYHVLFFLRRPSHGDSVHRASLRPGGREGHLHLPRHCQSSHHGLQVWLDFF